MFKNTAMIHLTLEDPLEQFNLFSFWVTSSRQGLTSLAWTTRCPFNKIVYNVLDNIISIWDTIYYAFYNILLRYIPTASFLFFIWSFLAYILFTAFVLKHTTITTSIVFVQKSIIAVKNINITKYLYSLVNTVGLSVIKSNTNLNRNEFFSILIFLFLFILGCNVCGLFPYTFTLSSAFVVTLFLAGTHYIAINIIGFFHQGWHFVNLFLPSGVPLVISPFLIIIELVSYLAKVLSLSIRLFANMMSGHALLKILIGFAWAMCASGGLLFISASIIPWLLVTSIMFLEALIAFLQAYVFIILVAIYLNDVIDGH
jgi:ATP synthase subunit 6